MAHALPRQVPTSPRVSQSDPAATASLSLRKHRDDRPAADDGARSSGGRAVLNHLQQVLNKMVRSLSRGPVCNPRATHDGTGGNGGLGAVLSFIEVYARRQACARGVTKSGLELLGTARELQQQQPESARKTFWGNPTDAMLGVVDVP